MCDTTGVASLSLRNPDLSPIISSKEEPNPSPHHHKSKHSSRCNDAKQNQVGTVLLFGVPIVSLVMDGKERLCLAQISSTLLKDFSYNEIHNRRVALGITCVQCTPVQLEILRRAGAMPVTSRRCGMITRREAERLCQSFLGDHAPPQLPENFAFEVYHECGWGSRGSFVPSRYNSSRAKCIRCTYCQLFFSPNKFIFHSHRLPDSRYVQPDAANFNSWRRHLKLCGDPPDEDSSSNTLSMDTAQIVHAWEDVRAMFNGGTRKRMLAAHTTSSHTHRPPSSHHREGGSSNSSGNSQQIVHPHRRNSTNGGKGGAGNGNPNKQSRNSSSQGGHNISSFVTNSHSPSHPNTNTTTSPPLSSFLPSVPLNPMISPTGGGITGSGGRLVVDTIWNPGLSPSSSRVPQPSTPSVSVLSQSHPHLPFHPLSIPWLRRPIFPFPHPFSSPAAAATAAAVHLLAENEKLSNYSTRPTGAGGNSSSAFRPVPRNAEHLFSWLNGGGGIGLGGLGGVGGGGSGGSLPEDLSIAAMTANHPPHSLALSSPNHQSEKSHSPVSSTNNDELALNRNRARPRHQIQIVSNSESRRNEEDSEDEETVDIESTEVEEELECSSTSFIWVTSTNNNNNVSPISVKKRLSVDSSNSTLSSENSGDEEKALGESCKRKRLWDFDANENKKSELCWENKANSQ